MRYFFAVVFPLLTLIASQPAAGQGMSPSDFAARMREQQNAPAPPPPSVPDSPKAARARKRAMLAAHAAAPVLHRIRGAEVQPDAEIVLMQPDRSALLSSIPMKNEKELQIVSPTRAILVDGRLWEYNLLSKRMAEITDLTPETAGAIVGRPTICCEVEFLEGENKGKSAFVSTNFVMVADAPKKAAAMPADPAARAKTLLAAARNLEKLGNTKGAVAYYRQVIALAPGSVEGVEALKRVQAIGQKSL